VLWIKLGIIGHCEYDSDYGGVDILDMMRILWGGADMIQDVECRMKIKNIYRKSWLRWFVLQCMK